MSILHSPGEDMLSGELPQERWNPTQSVRYVRGLTEGNHLVQLINIHHY